jgi:hypothetical protein
MPLEIQKQEIQSLKEKKESSVKVDLDVSGLAEDANSIIEQYADRLKDLPDSFQNMLHDNIVQYFLTSADRYDKDSEQGLDQAEFQGYKANMLKKLTHIIEQYAPSKEVLQAKEQQEEEAAEVARKTAEVEVSDIDFNESNLNTPQGIQQELIKLGRQNGQMREEATAISGRLSDFQNALQRFEKSKSSWSVFLRGSPFTDDPETERLQRELAQNKIVVKGKIKSLRLKQRRLKEYGVKMNAAGDLLRTSKIQEREGKLTQIDSQGAGLETTKKSNEKQYTVLSEQQQRLQEQQGAMRLYRDSLRAQRASALESERTVRVKSEDLQTFDGILDNTVSSIDESLRRVLPTVQRDLLLAKKEELLGHKKAATQGLEQTRKTGEVLTESGVMLENKTAEAEVALLDIDSHLASTIVPTMDTLVTALRAVEIAKLQSGDQREQVQAEYAVVLDTIDQADEEIANNVLQNNLSNEQQLQALEEQAAFLDTVEIDKPNVWNATGGLLFSKVGEGWTLLTKEVICGSLLDPTSKFLKNVTKDIPVLNVVTNAGMSIVLDMPSGLIEGAGELVSGVTMLVAHPADSAVGMASLVGRDPKTGKWSSDTSSNAWKEMGKALIAYKYFERGEIGKGIGKVGFEVLLTATGIGAAAHGAKGAKVAYLASRVGGVGAVRSAAKATGTAAKIFVTDFAEGVAKLPGEAVSTVGRLAKAPSKLKTLVGKGDVAADLEKVLVEATEELGTLTDELDSITIAGKPAKDMYRVKGKTADQLDNLSADELASLNLRGAEDIRQFMAYKRALKRKEKLVSNVSRQQTLVALAEISPDLPKVLKAKGKKARRVLDEFNAKHSDGFPKHAFMKLDETPDGIISFNEHGKLELFPDVEAYRSLRTTYLMERYKQPFGHGANSASLKGVLEHDGLVPTGELIDAGSPPFSGELEAGISKKGVNRDAVSVSIANGKGVVLDIDYARGTGAAKGVNTAGWTPSRGQSKVSKLHDQIGKLRQRLGDSAVEFREILERKLSTAEKQLEIENMRLDNWDNLGPAEQLMVSDPFPVVYRIKRELDLHGTPMDDRKFIMRDGTEGAYQGKVEFGEHIDSVLVPEDKVPLVKAYFKKNGKEDVTVIAMEAAEDGYKLDRARMRGAR